MAYKLTLQELQDELTEEQEAEMAALVQFLYTCNVSVGGTVNHPLKSYKVLSKAHRVLLTLGSTWYYKGDEGTVGTFVRRG